MLKGIVFDLDGTLVDSLAITFDAFNHGIIQFGGKKHTIPEIMSYFGTGEDQIFAKILGQDKAEAAYQSCREYFEAHLGEMPLHQGIDELLENFFSSNIPVSIFTGRSWNTTEIILKHHGLLDRFVTVVANDHVSSPKPAPEGLHLALTRMKLEPSEVLYVGDSPMDIVAGKAAGSQSVAALWDLLAKRDLIEPCTPHHWANHPKEVWEVWRKLRE